MANKDMIIFVLDQAVTDSRSVPESEQPLEFTTESHFLLESSVCRIC